mgnify:CR=1 FL=1
MMIFMIKISKFLKNYKNFMIWGASHIAKKIAKIFNVTKFFIKFKNFIKIENHVTKKNKI